MRNYAPTDYMSDAFLDAVDERVQGGAGLRPAPLKPMSPQDKAGNRGVYFTAPEWAEVRDAAYRLRISANEYVRQAVREKMERDANPQAENES